MADIEKKSLLVDEKVIKEGANGQYYYFKLKDSPTDKFGKSYSWFKDQDEQKREEQEKLAETIHKGDFVDITFYEQEGTYNGSPVTYRNLKSMKKVDAPQGKPAAGQFFGPMIVDEESMIKAADQTLKIAVLVRDKWEQEFLKRESLKDIPAADKVSIFSTMFIQTCRSLKL